MKLVNAKCPSCGANIIINNNEEVVTCKYCRNSIIVDEAIACYKIKVTGIINIDGIQSNTELISSANQLLSMHEYLKAKKLFLEFSEKCPNNYQGWLGLLICRTRNFTIRDNNILFENDIKRYHEHFLITAPDEIKEKYNDIINNYLNTIIPEKEKKLIVNNDTEGFLVSIAVALIIFFIIISLF